MKPRFELGQSVRRIEGPQTLYEVVAIGPWRWQESYDGEGFWYGLRDEVERFPAQLRGFFDAWEYELEAA